MTTSTGPGLMPSIQSSNEALYHWEVIVSGRARATNERSKKVPESMVKHRYQKSRYLNTRWLALGTPSPSVYRITNIQVHGKKHKQVDN